MECQDHPEVSQKMREKHLQRQNWEMRRFLNEALVVINSIAQREGKQA